MAVTIDIGEADNIHPQNKQEVGQRLAHWALAKTYGKDMVACGPLYKSMRKEGDEIILEFDDVGGGLAAKDGGQLDRLCHRRPRQEIRLGRRPDRRRHGGRLQPGRARSAGRALRLGQQPRLQPVSTRPACPLRRSAPTIGPNKAPRGKLPALRRRLFTGRATILESRVTPDYSRRSKPEERKRGNPSAPRPSARAVSGFDSATLPAETRDGEQPARICHRRRCTGHGREFRSTFSSARASESGSAQGNAEQAATTAADGVPRPESSGAPPSSAAGVPAPGGASAAATEHGGSRGPPSHRLRKWLAIAGSVVLGAAAVDRFLVPALVTALNTVSTDDAYVNSHVTFVAPRVVGQVLKVLVDDNYRVKKGTCSSSSTPSRTRFKWPSSRPPWTWRETDLAAAEAQVRGQVAQARANRFKLEHAIEDVDNQVANLRASVAILNSRKAALRLAEANLVRGEEVESGAISKEDLDVRRESVKVAEAAVDQSLQAIYALRVGLGLPAQPPAGHDLSEVPPELDQNFSSVRQALGELLQSAAQFGYLPSSWTATPKQAVEAFYKQDPEGNLNRIYARLIPQAPAIKQAQAKLLQARCDLDQAQLESPLLRHRQRDRRRGDGPQRQPRQQRPGGTEPDGSPFAHRDLDRRQFQGNATGGAAHRPAGALRSGHVRPAAGIRGPHHRLHHGNR